jgi:hypothetical protein
MGQNADLGAVVFLSLGQPRTWRCGERGARLSTAPHRPYHRPEVFGWGMRGRTAQQSQPRAISNGVADQPNADVAARSAGWPHRSSSSRPARHDGLSAGGCRGAEGTSRTEIAGPPRLYPSRRSQVRGWYTISGSYVGGPRRKNGWSPYSAQPGNIAAVEYQSIFHVRVASARSSLCLRQLLSGYPANSGRWGCGKSRNGREPGGSRLAPGGSPAGGRATSASIIGDRTTPAFMKLAVP